MKNLPDKSVIREFEYKIAEHCSSEYVLSVCNGTLGIMGVFYALGLQNCEVITTPLTWPGSIAGLLALNCKIRFCDVVPETLTIDPEKLSTLITPKTKAIFSADFLGYPAKLDIIKAICEKNKIWLIHDAASSFGSKYNGHYAGFYADVAILSFGKNKLFSIGEGGCVVTNNGKIYERLLFAMCHPEKQQIETGLVNPFALNTSMNPLAAAYGNDNICLQYKYIKDRAQRITNWIHSINIAATEKTSEPNYYKILISPKAKEEIQCNTIIKLTDLPFNQLIYDEPIYKELFKNENHNCPVAKFAIKEYSLINMP